MELSGSLYGEPWPNNPKISWRAAEVHVQGATRLKDHNENLDSSNSVRILVDWSKQKKETLVYTQCCYTRSLLIVIFHSRRGRDSGGGNMGACLSVGNWSDLQTQQLAQGDLA